MNIYELSIYDQVIRTTDGLECGRVVSKCLSINCHLILA